MDCINASTDFADARASRRVALLGAERIGEGLDELPHRRRQGVIKLVERGGEAVAEGPPATAVRTVRLK
jgi:hypothetical protein